MLVLSSRGVLAQNDDYDEDDEEFGCFRCHPGPGAWARSWGAGPGPTLILPGPWLSGLGRRAHRERLNKYLLDPPAHRPGTRMAAQINKSINSMVQPRPAVAAVREED